MPEYNHTTRHPVYWIPALLATAMGGGAMVLCSLIIEYKGLGSGPVLGLAIGTMLLAAGVLCIWRIIVPVRYRGVVTEQSISWHVNGAAKGRVSRDEVAHVMVSAFGDHEDQCVRITLKNGDRIDIRMPMLYFGSLARFCDDVEGHGYETVRRGC